MARSSNVVDISGETFGRLTAIRETDERGSSGEIKWFCVCECGNTNIVSGTALRTGSITSCGCAVSERMRFDPPGRTHGLSGTKTHRVWLAMRRRCRDENSQDYKHYGGRGISVCERWQKFENFLEDMGKCPRGSTIERLDVDGDYEPDNCEWASRTTQMNNTRRNHILTYEGRAMTMAEWSRKVGMSYTKLRARINMLHWPVGKALGFTGE